MKKIILSLLLLVTPHSTASAFVFYDDFNDNSLNPSWWSVSTAGDSTVQEINQRIELTQGTSGSPGINFNYLIQGDFTAEADYSLLNWPVNSRERTGLISGLGSAVERVSDAGFGGEVYLTHFGDGVQGIISTTDMAGKLKLERIGTTISGYYWGNDTWNLVHSYNNSTADANFYLVIWPEPPVFDGVKVAFDNFRLDAPGMDNPFPAPEPLSILLLGSGLLAGITRKKNAN